MAIARDNATQAGMFGEKPTLSRSQLFEGIGREGNQSESTTYAGRAGADALMAQRGRADAGAETGGQPDRAADGGKSEAQGQKASPVDQRPTNWRTDKLRAAGVARKLGIDPKAHKTLMRWSAPSISMMHKGVVAMNQDSKLLREFPPGYQASEPPTQLDLNRQWSATCRAKDTSEPDFSVLKPFQRKNCMTHSLAPWLLSNEPQEPESSSSET